MPSPFDSLPASHPLVVGRIYEIGDARYRWDGGGSYTEVFDRPGRENIVVDQAGQMVARGRDGVLTGRTGLTFTPSAAAAPVAPVAATAVAGNASATVSFTPSFNGGAEITGYTVTSSPGGLTGTGASSPIVVSGLTNGTPYTFTVTATNSVGTGSASAASNSVTPAATAPGAPTIGAATATGTTTATVAFTAPASNGGATITSYTATSSPHGVTATLNQAGSGTINVTGLTPNTYYTFTVRATNSAGASPPSAASNPITTDPLNISNPVITAFSPADNATNVAINANLVLTFSEAVTAVAAKNITIKKTSDNSTVAAIAANNGSLVSIASNVVTINPSSDLANGTEYYVLVDAGAFKDADDNPSEAISGTTSWSFTTVAAAPETRRYWGGVAGGGDLDAAGVQALDDAGGTDGGSDTTAGASMSFTVQLLEEYLVIAVPQPTTISGVLSGGLFAVSMEDAYTVTIGGTTYNVYRSTNVLDETFNITTS